MIRSFGVCLTLLALLLFTACTKEEKNSSRVNTDKAAIIKGVAVETVQTVSSPDMDEFSGVVRSRNSAVVSARISAVVSKLYVQEGDHVKSGQLLALLDAEEVISAANSANAGVEDAKRAVAEAKAGKLLSDTTFERYQKLLDERAVTRQEFDIKKSEKEVASEALARANARLKQLSAASQGASAVAGYRRVVAPVSGVIVARKVDVGATVFPAQILFGIDDDSSYNLELTLPESAAGKIAGGSLVQVRIDALAASVTTKVAAIVPASDSGSRTFIAKVPVAVQGLKSGMFGRAVISNKEKVSRIMLPVAAILERGALVSVWVLDSNKIAQMRLIKTGKRVADRVEILSGLIDGEKVVTSGVEKITEGARVE